VDFSTSVARRSPHNSKEKWATSSPRLKLYVWTYILMVPLYLLTWITHSPITLGNLSSINLVSILRCSSPPINPSGIYVQRRFLNKLSSSFPSCFACFVHPDSSFEEPWTVFLPCLHISGSTGLEDCYTKCTFLSIQFTDGRKYMQWIQICSKWNWSYFGRWQSLDFMYTVTSPVNFRNSAHINGVTSSVDNRLVSTFSRTNTDSVWMVMGICIRKTSSSS